MTDRERETYRRRLLELGARLKVNISGLSDEARRRMGGEASGSLSNAPLHMADLGTDSNEQDVAVSLLHNEQQVFGGIADALDRLDAGTFGVCDSCHRDIPAERLRAVLYATRCVECARRAEQEGQESRPDVEG
jgi:RNA polymerase-binding transcription factor DksA